MGFAENLKSLRIERGLTQEQLAQELGLSKGTIFRYETGKREPNFTAMSKIEKYFGVSANFLKGEQKNEDIEDIEYIKSITEESLYNSSKMFNQLLKTNSVLIRACAAQINMLFAEITYLEGVNDKDTLIYLKMCERLMYDINKFLKIFKQTYDNQQSLFNPNELLTVFDDGISTVINSLQNFRDYYIKKE